MPLKEFKCIKCDNKFTLLLPKDDKICPNCKSKELKELYSSFAKSESWKVNYTHGWKS